MGVKLGPFLGMSNMAREYIVDPRSRWAYVFDALNVDFTSNGRVSSRQGYTKKVSCVRPAGYVHGGYLYYASSGALYKAYNQGDELVSIALSGNLLSSEVCFELTPFGVVVSDATTLYLLGSTGYTPVQFSPPDGPVDYDADPKLEAGLEVLPAGYKLVMHGARLYSVIGNTVFFSEPYDYFRYRPFSGFLQFDTAVNVFESTPTGILIGAEKLYLMPDDPESGTIKVLSDDAPIKGSAKHKDAVFFVSPRYGIGCYTTEGRLVYQHQDRVAMPQATQACISVMERDGNRAVYATLEGVSSVVRADEAFSI